MKIGFVRRGFSPSGGAESYLKLLARGVHDAGHATQLFSTKDWPAEEWTFGELRVLQATSPIGFADELDRVWRKAECDLLMSLERVWHCHLYRAGDGVHRAWLERRAKMSSFLRRFLAPFNRKHSGIVRLEEALFAKRGAARVIVNSQMVKNEIVEFYGYPSSEIDLIYTGVPLESFSNMRERRREQRRLVGLNEDEIALLFAGSGWERKGLREAIEAVARCRSSKVRLLVAGRGNQTGFAAASAQFLGVITDMPALYAAADIFILPTFYDPFSNACLEALASGLPVITTRDNGFSEIIQDAVHGSIIDRADNTDALRDAIQFWCDAATRENARPAILQRASEFDISKNVERTLALLLQPAASAASASGKMRKT
jgi:UDP-glucose:(heptosyl)LPS alpha-1,3-glucosyltransferase